MSDQNTPHPVDRAYAEAEALLDAAAARRARRARILEAVAQEAAPETKAAPATARARRPSGWRYVGWLTAASIAGVGGLIAYQLSPVAGLPPVAMPGEVSSAPARPSAAPPPPARAAEAPANAAPLRRMPRPEERTPEAAQSAVAPTAPPARAAPPPVAAPEAAGPPPLSAFPVSQAGTESAEARSAPPPAAPMAAQAPAARVQGTTAASPVSLGARLRAAAAAGRTGEVAELLAEGAPIDARDNDGETALMKSIRANQPATVALLRRRGADPDLENRAGASARDMARAAGEPALERALEAGR